jgi:pyridoxamine 5'-phosphate oxidase
MTTDEIFRSTRKEYNQGALDEGMVGPDPLTFFRRWYEEALQSEALEPNACALATVGSDMRPSNRMVLLKGLDERGLTFYTNYLSRKGRQLSENPFAALLFFWASRERSVRIEGEIEKISSEESAAYFASRPRASQLGAVASTQSSVARSRSELEEQLKEMDAQYSDKPIPRPDQWGGYRLKPTMYEFWQGRENRMHDRIRYVVHGGTWSIERLWP